MNPLLRDLPDALRVDLTVRSTTVRVRPVAFDALKTMLGIDLGEVLSPLMVAARAWLVERRPGARTRRWDGVSVHAARVTLANLPIRLADAIPGWRSSPAAPAIGTATEPSRSHVTTPTRAGLAFSAVLVLAGAVGAGMYRHVTHAGLDETELPPALPPAELEVLRDRCRAEPRTCAHLGRVYLRAWAERTARGSLGPLRVTFSEESTAAYLYQKACKAGDGAACGVAHALDAGEPTRLIRCPTRRVRFVDEAGTPVVGVGSRSECRDEAGVTEFALDTSDVDGWIEVAGTRVLAGTRDHRVADTIVIPARAWHQSPTGGAYELDLTAGEIVPSVPLRRDPWPPQPAADVLGGWWWRQADPVSDQRRAPWIRLDLPGATGGVSWPEPPPRVLRLGDAQADAGVVQVGIDGRAQVLVAITADTIVALEWSPTGFRYPYVFRRAR